MCGLRPTGAPKTDFQQDDSGKKGMDFLAPWTLETIIDLLKGAIDGLPDASQEDASFKSNLVAETTELLQRAREKWGTSDDFVALEARPALRNTRWPPLMPFLAAEHPMGRWLAHGVVVEGGARASEIGSPPGCVGFHLQSAAKKAHEKFRELMQQEPSTYEPLKDQAKKAEVGARKARERLVAAHLDPCDEEKLRRRLRE